jgi:hypothetical protein
MLALVMLTLGEGIRTTLPLMVNHFSFSAWVMMMWLSSSLY